MYVNIKYYKASCYALQLTSGTFCVKIEATLGLAPGLSLSISEVYPDKLYIEACWGQVRLMETNNFVRLVLTVYFVCNFIFMSLYMPTLWVCTFSFKPT